MVLSSARRWPTEEEKAEAIRRLNPRFQFYHENNARTHLYAISDGEAVKFGSAWNVANRLKSLQVGHHRELTVLAKIVARPFLESSVHQYLKPHRIRGEWFRLCDETRGIVRLYEAGDEAQLVLVLLGPETD